MGRFIKSVRAGGISGPLRSGFTIKKWPDEYAKNGEDDEDRNLMIAGLLIHQKANNIRSMLKVTFSNNLRATTKVRAFAARANHDFFALGKMTRRAIEQLVKDHEDNNNESHLMMHQLAGIKLDLKVGASYSPDEIVQSIVDGTEVPLKRILEKNPDLQGNPDFSSLDWNELIFDAHLGTLYMHIEDLWDDCLWNGYRLARHEGEFIFVPKESEWQKRYLASRFRLDSLNREFAAHALQAQSRPNYKYFLQALGPINVKSITKAGRKQRINLSHFDVDSKDGIRLITMRAYASEPYYTDLLSESQHRLQGATLDQLLTAWIIISRASEVLLNELSVTEAGERHEPRARLPPFAPVIQIKALKTAISNACKTSLEQSAALLDFFVFRGKSDQELWAQPLLPVSSEAVTPVFAAIISPNLRRIVDVWLKQVGVDLSTRGPAFELHVCATLHKEITESPLLHETCGCLERGVTFKPSGEREEQIDVVALIGRTVIVGEAKCFLEPTEAKEIAMHRLKVIEAAEQVKRKYESAVRNKDEFRNQLLNLGLKVPEDFSVLPVVILNSAIHCGVAIDGTPIVDERILGVFLKGEFIELAVHESEKGFRPIKKIVLYNSAAEAGELISEFLSSPPQMKPLLDGLNSRWVPVPTTSENDWTGRYFTLDCIPKIDSFSTDVGISQSGNLTAEK